MNGAGAAQAFYSTRLGPRVGRTPVALWLFLPLLVLYGRAHGLSSVALVAALTTLGLSLVLLNRCTRQPERHLFGLAILLTGTLLISVRGLTGRADLVNIPQDYRLPFSSYNQTVALGSLAISAMIVGYLAVRPRRVSGARNHNELGNGYLFQWVSYVMMASVAITGRVVLLMIFGLGGKGAKTSFPGAGHLLLAFVSVSRLLVASLLLHALRTHDPRRLRTALLLLISDAGVDVLGGSRGAVLQATILLGACWLVSTRFRIGWRTVAIGAVTMLVLFLGTSAAIEQRQRVSGGSDFEVIEFLMQRTSGTNRLAPIIDADVRIGWTTTMLQSESQIKEHIYNIPKFQPVGIGTHAIGIGYLAQGTFGAIVIGVLFGVVARLFDVAARFTTRPDSLGLYVVLALFFLQVMQGLGPARHLRELVAIITMAAILRAFFPTRMQYTRTSLRQPRRAA